MKKSRTMKQCIELFEKYQAGKSLDVLAQEEGIHKSSLWNNVLKKASAHLGVPMRERRPGRSAMQKYVVPADLEASIRNGETTISQAAAQLGCHPCVLRERYPKSLRRVLGRAEERYRRIHDAYQTMTRYEVAEIEGTTPDVVWEVVKRYRRKHRLPRKIDRPRTKSGMAHCGSLMHLMESLMRIQRQEAKQ